MSPYFVFTVSLAAAGGVIGYVVGFRRAKRLISEVALNTLAKATADMAALGESHGNRMYVIGYRAAELGIPPALPIPADLLDPETVDPSLPVH